MFEEIVNRPSRWRTFWPEVNDLSGAREAIRLGVWFAYLGAILAAIATVDALLSDGSVVVQFFNAAMFGLIGLGLQRAWRPIAVFAVVVVGVSMIGALAQRHFPGVVTPFVFIAFINSVRGTFALKRLQRQAPQDVLPT